MAQAERRRKLKDDISTISNDLQSIMRNMKTSTTIKPTCELEDLSNYETLVDTRECIVSVETAQPVSVCLPDQVESDNQEKSFDKSFEKKKMKALKPIREEDQASSFVCVPTYKSIFKLSHHALKNNKIGVDSKSSFFRSPRALSIKK